VFSPAIGTFLIHQTIQNNAMKKLRIVLRTWMNDKSLSSILEESGVPMNMTDISHWEDADKDLATVLVEDTQEDKLLSLLKAQVGLTYTIEDATPVGEEEITQIQAELSSLRKELAAGGNGTAASCRGIRCIIRQLEDALEAHRKGKDVRDILNKTYTVASYDWD
jgi:hypothetical protein